MEFQLLRRRVDPDGGGFLRWRGRLVDEAVRVGAEGQATGVILDHSTTTNAVRGDAAGKTHLTAPSEGWNPAPTAAPVGFPTLCLPLLSGSVNRRFLANFPVWLEG